MEDVNTIAVESLLHDLSGATVSGNPLIRVSSVVFDSRAVTPGALFVAMRGGYVDGHDFLADARNSGAIAAVVEPDTDVELLQDFDCVVRAQDTRAALAAISAAFYRHPSRSLRAIGVTGTDGKTTTCWYLHQILTSAGLSAGLISTVAIKVPGMPDRSSARQTTPESLEVQRLLREMYDAGATVAVLETTSHALETHRVDHCWFDAGVVTNITSEHLDFHGSVEAYRAAKGGLLTRVASARRAGKLGAVVLNADDPGTLEVERFAHGADITWYSAGCDNRASIRAQNIELRPDSSSFTLTIGDVQSDVTLPLPGSWNIANSLAAAGTAYTLGCEPASIAAAIECLSPVPGRMERVDVGQPFTVLVDYAHTPESLRSVLSEARRLTGGRLLVAFGSAGERDIQKRSVQGAVAVALSDFSVFTSEDPRFEDPEAIIAEIASGALGQGAVKGVDFDCIEDRAQAIHAILARAQPGDVVVLAGKGHERSMIYGNSFRPWNEADVARSALFELGYGIERQEGTLA